MYADYADKQTYWWLLTALALLIVIFCSHYISQDITLDTHEVPESQEIQAFNELTFMSYTFPPVPDVIQSNKAASYKLNSDEFKSSNDSAGLSNEVISSHADKSNQLKSHEQTTSSDLDVQDLKSVNMRIKMPSNSGQARALGKFLYQCVNIGFGYIDGKQSGAVQMIHNAKEQHSQIFRQTQHALFENEKHWRSVYGTSNQYVRVYPAWLDRNLISHINRNLSGKNITSLSARYTFQNNLLQLIEITLNGKRLAQAWTLANGFDLGCR